MDYPNDVPQIPDQQIPVQHSVPPIKNFLDRNRLALLARWYKRLPMTYKVSVTALALMVVVIPISVVAVMQEVRTRSEAYIPITPPISYTDPTPYPTSTPYLLCDITGSCPTGYSCIGKVQPDGTSIRMCIKNATPAPTPVQACMTACTADSYCRTGMKCINSRCVNPSCPSSTSCTCASPTPTPKSTPIPTGIPAPTPIQIVRCGGMVCPVGSRCMEMRDSRGNSRAYCLVNPTPMPNSTPVITTSSLPMVYLGQSFGTAIQATDKDIQDSLTITASGLPAGLQFGGCQRIGMTTNSLYCRLTGRISVARSYPITFTVRDSRGASSSRTLPLTVRPWYYRWIPFTFPYTTTQ